MTVRFVPVHPVAPRLVEPVARGVEGALPWIAAEVASGRVDAAAAVDPSRSQARSGDLLAALSAWTNGPGERALGLTEVDLFVPVFTFVFGEGHLNGPAAVVSLHRLRPEAYGLPADDVITFRRAVTEAVHELGHTFGLRHCREPFCAMRASRSADEIDTKGPGFCALCEAAARKAAEA